MLPGVTDPRDPRYFYTSEELETLLEATLPQQDGLALVHGHLSHLLEHFLRILQDVLSSEPPPEKILLAIAVAASGTAWSAYGSHQLGGMIDVPGKEIWLRDPLALSDNEEIFNKLREIPALADFRATNYNVRQQEVSEPADCGLWCVLNLNAWANDASLPSKTDVDIGDVRREFAETLEKAPQAERRSFRQRNIVDGYGSVDFGR